MREIHLAIFLIGILLLPCTPQELPQELELITNTKLEADLTCEPPKLYPLSAYTETAVNKMLETNIEQCILSGSCTCRKHQWKIGFSFKESTQGENVDILICSMDDSNIGSDDVKNVCGWLHKVDCVVKKYCSGAYTFGISLLLLLLPLSIL